MPMYTVRQRRRYRATISISWFEQVASNEMIVQKLRDVGFSEVSVTGRRPYPGNRRSPSPDATAEIPLKDRGLTKPQAGVTFSNVPSQPSTFTRVPPRHGVDQVARRLYVLDLDARDLDARREHGDEQDQ